MFHQAQDSMLTRYKNILHKLPDILHDPRGNMICLGFKITFGINADNRLCVGRAEVHPIIIELYF